jgi:NAD(P)H-hydrate epimerase
MKPVASSAQAKQQDAAYEGDLGAVMERAGFAVARHASALGATYGSRVAVLAGTGNNGGDGYVAARHLARRGARVTVVALGEPRTREAAAAELAWRIAGGQVGRLGEPIAANLLIDSVFGVGFHGELPAEMLAWTGHPAPVVAVDVPSGLEATTGAVAAGTLPATVTVALSNYKLGHFLGSGPDVVGDVALVDLGMDPAEPTLLLCERADAPRPERPRDSHKWSAGSVGVVGGSAGMTGAAVLAAKAALNFGAGAVATFVPGGLAAEIDATHPEIMTHGAGSGVSLAAADPAEVLAAAGRFSVLIVGPGMGAGASGFVSELLHRTDKPVVLDADGLNAIGERALVDRRAATVITPHAGEFTRLVGETGDHAAARRLAERTGAIVLLKGPASIVASPGSLPWLVTSGGRELATVGSGDVLAGMIGALWARGLDPATAARSAAFWHGAAGTTMAAASSVTADSLAEAARRFAF